MAEGQGHGEARASLGLREGELGRRACARFQLIFSASDRLPSAPLPACPATRGPGPLRVFLCQPKGQALSAAGAGGHGRLPAAPGTFGGSEAPRCGRLSWHPGGGIWQVPPVWRHLVTYGCALHTEVCGGREALRSHRVLTPHLLSQTRRPRQVAVTSAPCPQATVPAGQPRTRGSFGWHQRTPNLPCPDTYLTLEYHESLMTGLVVFK